MSFRIYKFYKSDGKEVYLSQAKAGSWFRFRRGSALYVFEKFEGGEMVYRSVLGGKTFKVPLSQGKRFRVRLI